MTSDTSFGWFYIVGQVLKNFEPDLTLPLAMEFSEPVWTLAREEQSRDRLHRKEKTLDFRSMIL